jgi:hypothetical protein
VSALGYWVVMASVFDYLAALQNPLRRFSRGIRLRVHLAWPLRQSSKISFRYQTLPTREALASSSRVAMLSGQSGARRPNKPKEIFRSAPA